MKVFVVSWRCWDGSTNGIVDVFSTLEKAQYIVTVLENHGHDKYEIVEKELIE
jgi:hypothetical protein